MALILMQKIAVLFLMIAGGYVLVKTRLLSGKDSRVLSVISVYLIQPMVIVLAFQITFTPEVRSGFLLCLATGILIHLILLPVVRLMKRAFHLDSTEQASIIYSNAGILVIPLVVYLFGEEWVIYASGFLCVQLCFLWSHCVSLLSGEKKLHWKKILTNCNILSILAGILLAVTGLKLPGILSDAMSEIAAMMGPLNMILIGMILAEADLRKLIADRHVWKVCALKMLVIPLLILLFLWASHLWLLHPQGKTLLYISFMAVITPTAAMVTQLSQLYKCRPEYAGSINVLTTLVCIATMPLMTVLFNLLIQVGQ